MKTDQLHELLYQALETEMGGVQIYKAAVECAQNDKLREEWTKYLEQTERHVEIVTAIFERLGLETKTKTPGREIVKAKGEALLTAMEQARRTGDVMMAQLVAAECVVDAETKDHMNWELIGMCTEKLKGEERAALKEAYEEVEGEEDEHLYHTMGWTRELWIEALGMKAVLPPPEEQKHATTAIGAARAKNAREALLAGRR